MNLPPFLSRLKGRLEAPTRGPATFTVTLRDFLIVTYAVPAERARAHVPEKLALDMRPAPDGDAGEMAFVQTTCSFSDNLHWSPLGENAGGLSYHQSTYRILTKRGDRRGAFVLRTYVGTTEAYASQRAAAREVDYTPFDVHIAGDFTQGRYETYNVRAVGERGQTALDVRGLAAAGTQAPPPLASFPNTDDQTFFLTQREETYYHAAVGGIGLMPVEHAPLRPVAAELVAARLSLWTDLEVLSKDDLLRPVSVLIQPSVVFTTFPPRPTLLRSAPPAAAV